MPKRPDNVQRPWIVKRDKKEITSDKTNKNTFGDMSAFYNNSKWRSKRAYFIRRNPLCKLCGDKGIVKGAEVIDHITPIRQGGDMYNDTNLQPLCKVCHDKKSRQERDTIVYNKYNMLP
tara:strand:- start:17 stop:373 length:357 start_codon:yes stop_codon:yes gene_type:complete